MLSFTWQETNRCLCSHFTCERAQLCAYKIEKPWLTCRLSAAGRPGSLFAHEYEQRCTHKMVRQVVHLSEILMYYGTSLVLAITEKACVYGGLQRLGKWRIQKKRSDSMQHCTIWWHHLSIPPITSTCTSMHLSMFVSAAIFFITECMLALHFYCTPSAMFQERTRPAASFLLRKTAAWNDTAQESWGHHFREGRSTTQEGDRRSAVAVLTTHMKWASVKAINFLYFKCKLMPIQKYCIHFFCSLHVFPWKSGELHFQYHRASINISLISEAKSHQKLQLQPADKTTCQGGFPTMALHVAAQESVLTGLIAFALLRGTTATKYYRECRSVTFPQLGTVQVQRSFFCKFPS